MRAASLILNWFGVERLDSLFFFFFLKNVRAVLWQRGDMAGGLDYRRTTATPSNK